MVSEPVINPYADSSLGSIVSAYQGSGILYIDKNAPAIQPDSPSVLWARLKDRRRDCFLSYGLFTRRRWNRCNRRNKAGHAPLNLCEPIVQTESLNIGSRKTNFKSSCKLFNGWIQKPYYY
jgi:hypothetical protein